MAKQSEYSAQDQLNNQVDFVTSADPTATVRKPFIEPEISAAVDVLEATTFFQGGFESAPTN